MLPLKRFLTLPDLTFLNSEMEIGLFWELNKIMYRKVFYVFCFLEMNYYMALGIFYFTEILKLCCNSFLLMSIFAICCHYYYIYFPVQLQVSVMSFRLAIHSSIHQFIKYTHMAREAGENILTGIMNKNRTVPCPWGIYNLVEKGDINQITKQT